MTNELVSDLAMCYCVITEALETGHSSAVEAALPELTDARRCLLNAIDIITEKVAEEAKTKSKRCRRALPIETASETDRG